MLVILTNSIEQLTLRGPDDDPRSPGPHLSECVRSIALRTGLLKEGEDQEECTEEGFTEQAIRRMLVGLAWEDMLAKRLPHLVYHPGEVTLDGITGTIDLYCTEEDAVHEVKATWVSMRREIRDRWMWWAQLKGYCKMMGCRVGYLRVLYLNGDYRGSGPIPMVFRGEFEERELEVNWGLMVREKDFLYGG